MHVASLIFTVFGAGIVVCGLVPCLGWMNWIGVPMCAAACLIGILGLASDKDPTTNLSRNVPIYFAGILVPIVMGGIGTLRCILGSGLA